MSTTTPAKPRKLTPRQRKFVSEYAKTLNGTQAAIVAGYSPDTAAAIASENLTKPEIAAGVQERVSKALELADCTADRTIMELSRVAYVDVGEITDEHGNCKPLHEISEDARRAIAGVEVIIKNAEAGDGVTDKVHKIKMADKVAALKVLAQYHGLLVERREEVHLHLHYVDRVSEIRKVLAERRQGAIEVQAKTVDSEG